MKLPSPPSNPVTDALEQAAGQVGDAAEQVFEALIGAAGEVSPENAEEALKVLKASLLLAMAAQEEARGRLVARVDEGVTSVVDVTGAVIMVSVAVLVTIIGIVVAGYKTTSQAAERVATGVIRVGVAVAAFAVARTVAEGREVGKRLRGESASIRTAVANLEAEIGRLRARRDDADRIDARRPEREAMLEHLRRAARLVGEAAAAVGGRAPAGGGVTPGQGATSGAGGVGSLDRIERLVDRLRGVATRSGKLPPDVRAQFIEVCKPMPRMARAGMLPRVGTAVPPGRLK
ncbi:hypothetical protein [Aquabacterium humicola]|uniref:hypothetical protein n=1 Tax=Aquabacterium humicola TaxID=3237377 RepID=UPI002542A3C5|nr:hypothetical protein [Rubrivivax pictus]